MAIYANQSTYVFFRNSHTKVLSFESRSLLGGGQQCHKADKHFFFFFFFFVVVVVVVVKLATYLLNVLSPFSPIDLNCFL